MKSDFFVTINKLMVKHGIGESTIYRYLSGLESHGYRLATGHRTKRTYTQIDDEAISRIRALKKEGYAYDVAILKTAEEFAGGKQLEMPIPDQPTPIPDQPTEPIAESYYEGEISLAQLIETIQPGQVAYSVTDKHRKYPIRLTDQGLMRYTKEGQEYQTKNVPNFLKAKYFILQEYTEASCDAAMKAIEEGYVVRPKGTQEWLTAATVSFNYETLRGAWEIKDFNAGSYLSLSR